MLGYYKYGREEIADIIKNSPKTTDGYYYVRNFPYLNIAEGKIDNKKDGNYYYPRDIFSNKLVFNDKEIISYLSKDKTDLNVEKMKYIDDKIEDVISELSDYGLNENIPGRLFNLNELIDTTIYFYNMKS
jgi:hypothetical protein